VVTHDPGAAGAAGADPSAEASNETGADTAEASCGEPEALARYAACSQAKDKAGCQAAGGTWTLIGLAPFEECQCLTGQQNCGCTGPESCLTSCVAEPVNGVLDCTGVVKGHCSAVKVTVGCWCMFGADGGVQAMCMD
jgi:hypothetical protein